MVGEYAHPTSGRPFYCSLKFLSCTFVKAVVSFDGVARAADGGRVRPPTRRPIGRCRQIQFSELSAHRIHSTIAADKGSGPQNDGTMNAATGAGRPRAHA